MILKNSMNNTFRYRNRGMITNSLSWLFCLKCLLLFSIIFSPDLQDKVFCVHELINKATRLGGNCDNYSH